MPSRKKKSRKAYLASRPVPKTDANQSIKESLAEKERQKKALIKKIAEMRAKQELERRQHEAMGSEGKSSTTDGLASDSE